MIDIFFSTRFYIYGNKFFFIFSSPSFSLFLPFFLSSTLLPLFACIVVRGNSFFHLPSSIFSPFWLLRNNQLKIFLFVFFRQASRVAYQFVIMCILSLSLSLSHVFPTLSLSLPFAVWSIFAYLNVSICTWNINTFFFHQILGLFSQRS